MSEETENVTVDVKPVGTPPQGWAFKKLYIDSEGNKFEKGKFKGKATPDEVVEMANKKEDDSVNKAIKETKKEIKESKKEVDNTDMVAALMEIIKTKTLSADEIVAAIKRGNESNTGVTIHKGLDTLDVNDILKPPVRISGHGSLFVIYDYLLDNGEVTVNPTGRVIELKHKGSKKNRTAKEESIKHFCAYDVRSKKLLEWLRKHPMYNKSFFEDSNMALNTDYNMAQNMAQLWNKIESWDKPQVYDNIEKIKGKHPEIMNYMAKPLSEIKIALSQFMCMDIVEAENNKTIDKARSNQINFLMNGK